ncbi:hypothetical protein PAAG_06319 [Paracoccidioides lutzii Pb01]|uniref:Uncharacterized protein n=1 Tax=Paracoccidioides lutzii (strain ATCC MYA-826 / Pb01) TaxID=502779 RepID=C1H6C8_PARBA|nr:hypothetical protein PAAG_06319 [Paracoccidioides lutzii Pb01]EEH35272.2 hypothetical protein PAAG_06319 [Paracoccidioides lutzii Pb01]
MVAVATKPPHPFTPPNSTPHADASAFMLDSPAKRRRSNSSSAIAVNASNTAQQPQTNGNDLKPPQRPSRASFQSPTRASLARSHPDVLSRVMSRSPAKTAQLRPVSRGREKDTGVGGGTEDGWLGIRANRPPSFLSTSAIATSTATATIVADLPIRQPSINPSLSPRHRSSVPVPPVAKPLSKPSQLSRVSISPEPWAQFSALRPSTRAGDNLNKESGLVKEASEDIVSRGRRTRSSSSPGQLNGEPELPPTPTELGLERLPNRPRGLLSSSSPSYRQEKKRERRLRDGAKKPSPLRPRDTVPAGDDGGNGDGNGNGVRSPNTLFPEEEVPDELGEKQKLRDALAAQLARLKGDIAKIEYESQRYKIPDDYPAPDEEIYQESNKRIADNLFESELLTTSNPSCAPPLPPPPCPPPLSSVLSSLLPFSSGRFIPSIELAAPPPSPPPNNPFALQQPVDLTPYLTLFAPLSLTATTATTSSARNLSTSTQETHSSSPLITQTHHFTLSAPSPFPAHLFQIPISLQTNPATQTVISISTPTELQSTDPKQTGIISSGPNIPAPLSSWLTTRLSSPLLQRDISGLCWGVSRYWEADISRAKIWVQLEELRDRISTQKSPSSQQAKYSKSKSYSAHTLLPHLGRTSFLFSTIPQKPQNSIHPSTPTAQLLVICPLTLDLWTSEPQLEPDISVSVPKSSSASSSMASKKVEKEAKRVFASFMKSGGESGNRKRKGGHEYAAEIDGDAELLVRAVEGVVWVVFGVV